MERGSRCEGPQAVVTCWSGGNRRAGAGLDILKGQAEEPRLYCEGNGQPLMDLKLGAKNEFKF